MRLLLDLIIDPFDDVRGTATGLLKLLLLADSKKASGLNSDPEYHMHHNTGRRNVQMALERATNLLRRTGRADYADGVGRIWEILYQCPFIAFSPVDPSNRRRIILNNLLSDLENYIEVARNNLPQAVSNAPLPGSMISLRYFHPQIQESDL